MADNLRRPSNLPLVPGGRAGDPDGVYVINCPRHGRIMVPHTRIRRLHNTSQGILLELECWCGTLVTLRTGRHREPVSA